MIVLFSCSAASSRLGRALAELFGLLVKLCVGSPVRQRRSHHTTNTGTAPTPAARSTASSLTKLLTKGLSWQPPPYTPTPRFRYDIHVNVMFMVSCLRYFIACISNVTHTHVTQLHMKLKSLII